MLMRSTLAPASGVAVTTDSCVTIWVCTTVCPPVGVQAETIRPAITSRPRTVASRFLSILFLLLKLERPESSCRSIGANMHTGLGLGDYLLLHWLRSDAVAGHPMTGSDLPPFRILMITQINGQRTAGVERAALRRV